MKRIKLAILAFCVAYTSTLSAQETVEVSLEDSLPELCVAAFLVQENQLEEIILWREIYTLNEQVISAHLTILKNGLIDGSIDPTMVNQAVTACIEARVSEELMP